MMTQIKLFSGTTYENSGPKINDLQEKVNAFLEEQGDKIVVKDIKYSVQSPNPHQVLNLDVKEWTIMVIYEVS